MRYLLDTDALSNLLKSTPSTVLIARLAIVDPVDQATSSITLGELTYGAHRLETARCRKLLQRIEEQLLPNLPVLPFDALAARRYGKLRASLERAGRPRGDADLRIAAIALVHECTVVSGNVRHFGQIPGLLVENWLQE